MVANRALAPRALSAEDWTALWHEYTPQNAQDTIDFLEKNPGLAPVLLEIAHNLHTFFPERTFRLGLAGDIESQTDSADHLVVAVPRGDMSFAQAYQALDQFEEAWWLDHFDQAYGRVFINIDPL